MRDIDQDELGHEDVEENEADLDNLNEQHIDHEEDHDE